MNQIKEKAPGVLLCLAIALFAWILGRAFPVIGGPVFAILAGMVLALFYREKNRTRAGIAFTSKKILQYAVILLGFGLNLSEIARVGAVSLPIILSTISTSLIIAFVLCRLMRMPSNLSVLVGVGSSICGGSAIAATAPVISADDEDIAQSISVIFLFPALGMALGLSDQGFGLFAGTAVNDTSSVTAAAAAWDGMHPGANTLDAATIVKLTRTLAIIPITLALAFWNTARAKKSGGTGKNTFQFRRIFPFFILFFILASLIATVCTQAGVSSAFFSPFKELSKFLIVMAMAAIGLNTDLVKLIRTGGKPIFMGFCCWAGIACVSLAFQKALGIW